jgi:aspartate aminotransferase-like enzyme
VQNTRQIDVGALNTHLSAHGMAIANGYGPLKGKTFRIGHMGEIQPADLEVLFSHIDSFLAGA